MTARAGLWAIAALTALGCGETGIRDIPNDGPIADVSVVSELDGEAILARVGQVVLGDTARFDGSFSVDPDAAADDRLRYVWTLLARPEGSAAELDVPAQDDSTDIDEEAFPTLEPDVEGT